MRIFTYCVVIVAAINCFQVICADDKPTTPTNDDKGALRVIDVVVVSSNQVRVGTNAMSIADATDLMLARRDKTDAVVVHDSIERDSSVHTQSPIMVRLARAGMPLVIVDKNGEYAWRDQSNADGVRVVKIGTDQFASLRRFLRRGKASSDQSPSFTLQTSVELDTTTGDYELNRVELGLFGERVWLMHEQREAEDESGTIGIQIKKEW